MAEQEEKNINNFSENSLKSIKKLYKREYINLNLDLENENFKNNFDEIIKNPSSNYCNEIHLFSKIPNLKLQKNDLEIETKNLNDLKENLEKQIYGNDKSQDEIEEIGLKAFKDRLKIEIDGDPEAEKDSIKYIGLKSHRNNLEKDKNALEKWIYGSKYVSEEELKSYKKDLYDGKVDKAQEEEKIKEFGLKKYSEFLNNEIIVLRKKYEIAENLSTLIKQSTRDKKSYFFFMILVIAALSFSSWYAYEYGAQIIVEIHGMKERTSSDYFGFFLMKMPFSLIIIAFISGAFIFINKLLFIIERINNQLRNFSKISVIASQMDKAYIDLIKNGNFSNGNEAEQSAHKEAEQKNLFYKLITNYLVSLSKNEADLADSKKEPLLKQVKQIAGIVKEFNSFNKDK